MAPENTIAAIRAAEQSGACGVEIDVQCSRDGVPVLHHDDTLLRVAGDRASVHERTWRELRALDAGTWFSEKYAGERIPSLREVLLECGGRLRFNFELKDASAAPMEGIHAVAAVLREFSEICSRSMVTSFSKRALLEFRKCGVSIETGRIFDRAPAIHELVDPVASVSRTALTENIMRHAQTHGIRVYIWTVNRRAEARAWTIRGAAGVISDDPGRMLRED